jgi:1,4-dihydroxy-2-naphthoyl-CoA hydrolase
VNDSSTSDAGPDRHVAGDGPGQAIGLTYSEVGAELARATAPVAPIVQQPAGLVHGGVLSLIAESMASHATAEAVGPEGMVPVGMSNAATFLRPITAGTIHAEARRRHGGRTTWIWDVEFTDDDGRLCAMVRMTIAVRPLRRD